MRDQKYKTEAETFGWSFVFQDFVSEELKSKVTQRIEVLSLYYHDFTTGFTLVSIPTTQLHQLHQFLFSVS